MRERIHFLNLEKRKEKKCMKMTSHSVGVIMMLSHSFSFFPLSFYLSHFLSLSSSFYSLCNSFVDDFLFFQNNYERRRNENEKDERREKVGEREGEKREKRNKAIRFQELSYFMQ